MIVRYLLLMILFLVTAMGSKMFDKEKLVKKLVEDWAPLVWLAPGERFLPIGVPEFLENMLIYKNYLHTRADLELLLQNRSSFLYGRKPAGTVPVYALVKQCSLERTGQQTTLEKKISNEMIPTVKDKHNSSTWRKIRQIDDLALSMIRTNDVFREESKYENQVPLNITTSKQLRFHVTYWMFYSFSEGKAVCVLDLGYFGTWPIPTMGGMCFGKFKDYGNHVGDWEHMSLYFENADHPSAMYVSAHDAGAFYRYDRRTRTFNYESQETRKGIFQKPIFPERVFTSENSHPVLFSARGSHGLWTAPGKHKFVRLPRLYDESGFGAAWPTWKYVEILSSKESTVFPGWMNFKGKWGNPQSNCHPLARFGFNICEFVDGPTGIPMKKSNFQC